MPKPTTFTVSGWVERHYLLEIEATSYEEAESKAEALLECSEPSHLYDYDNGKNVCINDVECQDPEWHEENWDE